MSRLFQNKNQDSRRRQAGQTLIETLAAVFILIMGITAAVGLAIYAFSNSTNITKQIVAIGLAREGIEAIRNMRDINWLESTLSINCYNFSSSTAMNASCYSNWLNPVSGFNYNLNPPGDQKSYRIKINAQNLVDPQTSLYWSTEIASDKYGLSFNPDVTSANFIGYYVPETTNNYGPPSDFYRKVTLITLGSNSAYPYNQNLTTGPRLHVISQVWWTDKKCPRHTDWQDDGKCSVQLETNLTNWKDY